MLQRFAFVADTRVIVAPLQNQTLGHPIHSDVTHFCRSACSGCTLDNEDVARVVSVKTLNNVRKISLLQVLPYKSSNRTAIPNFVPFLFFIREHHLQRFIGSQSFLNVSAHQSPLFCFLEPGNR